MTCEHYRKCLIMNLTIENVPYDLLENLRQNAAKHGRSLSSEVIERLKSSTPRPRPINLPNHLADIRELRASLNSPPLTDDFLEQAITEGRP